MKTHLLFLCLLFIAGTSVFAQITINSGNIVDNNDVVCQAKDTFPQASINPGNSGTNQTWDFSSLAAHTRDTLRFMHPSLSPYDTAFSGDNISVVFTSNNQWAYYYKDAGIVEGIGIVGDLFNNGSVVAIALNPKETIIKFPFTYQDSYDDTTGLEIIMDTIKMVQTTYKHVLADAWGSITTPAGTFNSIRVFSTKIQTQTYYILTGPVWFPAGSNTDTSYHYEWWTDNSSYRFPLASFTWNQNNSSVESDVEFLEEVYVSVPITNQLCNQVFPNPSKGLFIIEADQIKSIEIFNLNGQEILISDFNYPVSSLEINLQNQPKGFYYMKLKTKNGTEIKKLIIN